MWGINCFLILCICWGKPHKNVYMSICAVSGMWIAIIKRGLKWTLCPLYAIKGKHHTWLFVEDGATGTLKTIK